MKLNRSKYMPRRKNREVLTVEVPRKDGSQENMASFFFFRENAFKPNLVCFFNDNSFPFSTKLLALG